MAKRPAVPPDHVAYEAIRHAHAIGRIVFFTDPHLLNRPGSPVYNPLDVFAPTVVLMASSLTLLFAFGMLQWIVGLVFILLYQVYGAKHLVEWRMHRRTVEAIMRNGHNFRLLWETGGVAIALKDWPERNVMAPSGDWRVFAGDFLVDPSSPSSDEPAA